MTSPSNEVSSRPMSVGAEVQRIGLDGVLEKNKNCSEQVLVLVCRPAAAQLQLLGYIMGIVFAELHAMPVGI